MPETCRGRSGGFSMFVDQSVAACRSDISKLLSVDVRRTVWRWGPLVESFWSRMQVELLDRKRWHARIELANAIFEYLEIWHDRQRRHTSLGMLTPIEFETRHQHQPAA